jgi:hypothetical protein
MVVAVQNSYFVFILLQICHVIWMEMQSPVPYAYIRMQILFVNAIPNCCDNGRKKKSYFITCVNYQSWRMYRRGKNVKEYIFCFGFQRAFIYFFFFPCRRSDCLEAFYWHAKDAMQPYVDCYSDNQIVGLKNMEGK